MASLRTAAWVPLCFFAFHQLVANVLRAQRIIPWIDMPMHFFGGAAIAYFFWASLRRPEASAALGELTAFARFLFALCGVGAATVLWEFAEWVTDALGLTGAQVSLDDTILDMALGIAGGLCLLLLTHGSDARLKQAE
ncbi:MAG: hypothetical protein GY747_06565 [Planctomycetes bacterium]|nr:hypothetical protein [Planctomycetota bacterium]MCP4771435.1 hypothetical protein [Planctomycetota bacterium]MCP4861872.1 hypothetical protein [Planctomycetota bacterium]